MCRYTYYGIGDDYTSRCRGFCHFDQACWPLNSFDLKDEYSYCSRVLFFFVQFPNICKTFQLSTEHVKKKHFKYMIIVKYDFRKYEIFLNFIWFLKLQVEKKNLLSITIVWYKSLKVIQNIQNAIRNRTFKNWSN